MVRVVEKEQRGDEKVRCKTVKRLKSAEGRVILSCISVDRTSYT